MEAAPPSYEKATLVNAWHLVADYLPLRDLLSVALVCKAWHAIFVPHIWGNPASQFGGNNERICGQSIVPETRRPQIPDHC